MHGYIQDVDILTEWVPLTTGFKNKYTQNTLHALTKNIALKDIERKPAFSSDYLI